MALTETSNVLRGAFREVRLALDEMFRGGKLDTERELTVQTLFGLLGALARADGVVSAEEASLTNELMEELELPTQARQLASEAFDRGRRQLLNIDQEIARFLVQFPKGSSQADHLFNSLVRLAMADGRVRPGERTFLEKVTQSLGFSVDVLDTRIKNFSNAIVK
jgi:DnaJ like chaperone protein